MTSIDPKMKWTRGAQGIKRGRKKKMEYFVITLSRHRYTRVKFNIIMIANEVTTDAMQTKH